MNLNHANMDDCMKIGISGNCGLDCPVLIRGDCESADEMYAEVTSKTETQNQDYERAMEILK